MPDAGLQGYREKRQFKVALSDVVGTTSDLTNGLPTPPATGLLEVKFDTLSGPVVGLSLRIDSQGHDGHPLTTPYTTWAVSGLESWTDTVGSASSDTELVVEIRGERLYAREDGLWELRIDELEIFVDGVSQHSDGPYTIVSDLSHTIPSALPVFGLFPDLSGFATPYPVLDVCGGAPTPAPAWTGSLSGNVTGGYREYVDGEWVEHPTLFDPASIPSLSCDCEAPEAPVPTNTTTWDFAAAFLSQGGRTSQLVEEPYDCDPCFGTGVNRWTINTSYSSGYNAKIGLIPDFDRGIVRLNPDFEAFWARYALPEAKKIAEKTCTIALENGTPVVVSDDVEVEVFPEQSAIIEVVADDVEGSLEDTFAFRVECPHEIVSYADVNSWTLPYNSDACAQIGDLECPPGPQPDFEIKTCSVLVRQKLEGAESPPANDIGQFDTGHARGRYVNYCVHPHASFTNWFENWELNGTPEPWGSYWSPIGQQWMYNSSLPSGQQTKRRNDQVSDVMGEQVMGPIWDTVADPYRLIGVSRFSVVEPEIQGYTYDSDSEELWTLDNCTGAFGASIVLSPSGAGTIEAALSLASWTHTPYLFAQACKWFTQSWVSSNVSAIRFYLENIEGTRRQIQVSSGVEFARPLVKREPNYAGSYGIDNGNGALTNIGADILASGRSLPTMADEIRCGCFQFLSGFGAARLVIQIDPVDENEDVTLGYPEIRAPEEWFGTWESRQCVNLVSSNGPGIRLGNRCYWDGSDHQVPPDAYGLGYTWSALDMKSDLNVQFEGKAADDSLSTWIASLLDSVEGQDEEAATECRGFHLEGLKFAFVNPLREGVPLAWYPRKKRDSDYAETGDFGLWTYTIAQKPRTFVHPHKSVHLHDDSGVKVSVDDSEICSGWKRTHFYGEVTNSESLDWEMRARKRLGYVRPWNGWFITSALGGLSPWNSHTPWGHYHRTNRGEDEHEWHRSLWAVPPFEMDQEHGDRDELRFAFDYRGSGFTAVWSGDDGVYAGSTYDDGETLGSGDLILPDCTHPHILPTQEGGLICFGYEGSSGKIAAKVRGPGDAAWSSLFYLSDGSSDLLFEDDTFAVAEARDGAQRLVLAAVKAGDDFITEFYSTDQAVTWTEV